MGQISGFAFGLVVGWAARSTVDSSREMVVKLVSLGFTMTEHVRRILALERERLDDLVAEGRHRAEGEVDGVPASKREPAAHAYT